MPRPSQGGPELSLGGSDGLDTSTDRVLVLVAKRPKLPLTAPSRSTRPLRAHTPRILGMASPERRLVNSLWDLRDDAYDHPERWNGVTAEAVFQRLAEVVEEAGERGEPIDWSRDVAARMIAWRTADDQG